MASQSHGYAVFSPFDRGSEAGCELTTCLKGVPEQPAPFLLYSGVLLLVYVLKGPHLPRLIGAI
jgi:hypothetical protein